MTAFIPRRTEVSRDAGLILVQGSQELSLSRAPKPVIPQRQRVALVAVDLGNEITEVLEIARLNLRTDAHHQRAKQDHPVLALVLALLGTVLREELVTSATAKLGAELVNVVGEEGFLVVVGIFTTLIRHLLVHGLLFLAGCLVLEEVVADLVDEIAVLITLKETWVRREVSGFPFTVPLPAVR